MDAGKRYGYYTAGAFLVVPTLRSLCDNAIMQIMFRVGMHVSQCFCEYKQLNRLSDTSRELLNIPGLRFCKMGHLRPFARHPNLEGCKLKFLK